MLVLLVLIQHPVASTSLCAVARFAVAAIALNVSAPLVRAAAGMRKGNA